MREAVYDHSADAAEAVRKHFPGREITGLRPMNAGLMHRNFAVTFANGTQVFYRGHNADGPGADYRDIYFGDPLSLEREVAVTRLLAKTGIPVPEVYALEERPCGPYALLSYLPGVHFSEYLATRGNKLDVFLGSLVNLGRTLALAGGVAFDSFGAIGPESIINGRRYLRRDVRRHPG